MTGTEEWLAERQAAINDLPEQDREFPWAVTYYGDAYDLGGPPVPEGCEVYLGNVNSIDMGTLLPLATSIVDTHNNAPKVYAALSTLLHQHVPSDGICQECERQGVTETNAVFPCSVRRTIEESLA